MKTIFAFCFAALLLTSCEKKAQVVEIELSAEQKVQRQKLLKNVLDVSKSSKHPSNFVPEGFVGREISDFAELVQLADTVLKTDKFTRYTFELEDVSMGPSGWGVLVIKVADGRVTNADVVYPEY